VLNPHAHMLSNADARCSVPIRERHARVGRTGARPVVGEAGDVLPSRKVAQVPHAQRAVVAAARQHERGQPVPGDDVHIGLVRRHLPRVIEPAFALTALFRPPVPTLGRLPSSAALPTVLSCPLVTHRGGSSLARPCTARARRPPYTRLASPSPRALSAQRRCVRMLWERAQTATRERTVSCGPCARVSQTRMVRSTEADANTVASLGLHCRSSTEPSWPCAAAQGPSLLRTLCAERADTSAAARSGSAPQLYHRPRAALRCSPGRCPSGG